MMAEVQPSTNICRLLTVPSGSNRQLSLGWANTAVVQASAWSSAAFTHLFMPCWRPEALENERVRRLGITYLVIGHGGSSIYHKILTED